MLMTLDSTPYQDQPAEVAKVKCLDAHIDLFMDVWTAFKNLPAVREIQKAPYLNKAVAATVVRQVELLDAQRAVAVSGRPTVNKALLRLQFETWTDCLWLLFGRRKAEDKEAEGLQYVAFGAHESYNAKNAFGPEFKKRAERAGVHATEAKARYRNWKETDKQLMGKKDKSRSKYWHGHEHREDLLDALVPKGKKTKLPQKIFDGDREVWEWLIEFLWDEPCQHVHGAPVVTAQSGGTTEDGWFSDARKYDALPLEWALLISVKHIDAFAYHYKLYPEWRRLAAQVAAVVGA